MKFIHLADAHLDSPFLGLSFLPSNQFEKIKNASFESFSQIIDDAIAKQVDLVLLAGDNFDSVQPSPKSQLFLYSQIQRLIDNKIQVVMILGNHDYLNKNQLILPDSPYFKLLGSNQEVETATFETKDGFTYRVSGFSYQENHITEDMVKKFPEKQDNIYTIGLMHAGERSNQASQDNYAPFSVSELKALNYDYFALGHIHLCQILSQKPFIAYSGNIQGRHINESGEKGYLLQEVNEQTNETSSSFVATAPIIWKRVSLNLDKESSQEKVISLIKEKLSQENRQTTLFALEIRGSQYLNQEMIDLLEDKESLMQLSNGLSHGSKLVKTYLEQSQGFKLNSQDAQAFEKAQEEIFTEEYITKLANDLAKKSPEIKEILGDKDFINEIEKTAQLKLEQKMKDVEDENN